jgi:PRC-barrel domain
MSATTHGTAGGPATAETPELIASNKVEGTAVYNQNGDKLGSIYNFMVRKHSGQVAYAVLSFGGFLGMGASYHPLPWNALKYDTALDGYVVNLTKEELEGAPTYSDTELAAWGNPEHRRRIDNYYGGLRAGGLQQH